MSTTVRDRSERRDQATRGFGWRRLQVGAAAAAIAAFVAPMLLTLSFEGFLIAMTVPLVVGLLVLWRWPRVGAIWLGVVSLALLGTSAPFLVDALAHPESIADFVPLSAFTLATLIGVVAAIPSFRQGRDPDSPSSSAKRVGVAATGLFAAAVVVSVVAFTGIESIPARADDIQIVTSDLRFEPAAIEADGGTISVHVTNRDSTRHTFTVDELGVDLSIPPDSAQRVTFMAEAGTYRFYCRPHAPGMEGHLIVA